MVPDDDCNRIQGVEVDLLFPLGLHGRMSGKSKLVDQQQFNRLMGCQAGCRYFLCNINKTVFNHKAFREWTHKKVVW